MKQSEILSHFLSKEMITKKIKLLIPKEKGKLYNIILKNLNDFEIESYEVDANGNCSLRIYAKTKSPKEPIELLRSENENRPNIPSTNILRKDGI